MKHSPTPWAWREGRTALLDAKGRPVLQDGDGIWDLLPYREERNKEIDAAFILRAVNNHDALLAALRSISLASQNSMSSKEECGRIARIAIANATKEN